MALYLLKHGVSDIYVHSSIRDEGALLKTSPLHIECQFIPTIFSSQHITQLLGCVVWDKVSGENHSLLITRFSFYGEYLRYAMWTFDMKL